MKNLSLISIAFLTLMILYKNFSSEKLIAIDNKDLIFQLEQKLDAEPEKNPGWTEQWKLLKLEQGATMDPYWNVNMREQIKNQSYARNASNLVNIKELGPSNIAG
ncbi:MAG: hypothetical protein AAGK97_16630, partial [Bacteroidota bacterium]